MTQTLRAGTLAYVDTFGPLVPVKVLRVFMVNDPYVALPRTMAEVRVTATRGAYSRGEILTEQTRDLVQRKTRRRGGHTMVRSFDAVEVTP